MEQESSKGNNAENMEMEIYDVNHLTPFIIIAQTKLHVNPFHIAFILCGRLTWVLWNTAWLDSHKRSTR